MKWWKKSFELTGKSLTCSELVVNRMKRISFILTALLVMGCGNNQTTSPTLDEVFASRRSIRAYEAGKTISEAEVRELLTATQNAPSWANMQPSKYYVAIGDDLRKLFEIPENETILAVIALGYRAQEPNVPVHRPLDEIVKFY